MLLFAVFCWIAISDRHEVDKTSLVADPADWLFLRNGSTPPFSREEIEILVVGDIMPSRDALGVGDPFRFISREVAEADLAFGNLEGVITPEILKDVCLDRKEPPPELRLILPPESAALLQRAGFDLLGLSNNHTYDCAYEGMQETWQGLKRSGLQPVGSGAVESKAYQPVYFYYDGLPIAFLAFNPIGQHSARIETKSGGGWQPQTWQQSKALQAVRLAGEQADFVIVSMHWGEENNLQADLWQRETAWELVSAGADLIFGHHPHVIQETQVVPRLDPVLTPAFVAFSLGNFMFDQYETHPSQGLALRVFIDKQGLKAVQALPLHSTRQPRWMNSKESREIIKRIGPEPARSAFVCDTTTCNPAEAYPGSMGGLFTNGSIDLTGDGQAERIWLHEGRIHIYRENELIWESPIEWNVVDAALGDPNDDGRFEILAAVNGKKDGKFTSQPFILGYRSGMFRQMWGGSPVSDPIREVEIGDLDADGKQELVVIEESGAGKQAVAVWKWHGWGFSLFWRSLEDRFTDLMVQEMEGGVKAINVGLSW